MLGTHFAAGETEAIWNKLSCPRADQSAPARNWTSDPLITSPTPNQLSYFVPIHVQAAEIPSLQPIDAVEMWLNAASEQSAASITLRNMTKIVSLISALLAWQDQMLPPTWLTPSALCVQTDSGMAMPVSLPLKRCPLKETSKEIWVTLEASYRNKFSDTRRNILVISIFVQISAKCEGK